MRSSDSPLTRVVFFQVRDNPTKLRRICETASAHFGKKEPLLFFVEDEKAQKFVDELLWKAPPTSFLPHVALDEETRDWIAITKGKKNINQAKIAFNLCTTPLLIDCPIRILYEFEDLTDPNKKRLSNLRFDRYKQENFLIEARSSAN